MASYQYEDLYSRLPGWGTKLDQANPWEYKICCPFHKEDTPSCHINLETGRWWCFGKCDRGGSHKEIEAHLGLLGSSADASDSGKKTAKTSEEDAPKPPIDPSVVERLHKALLNNEQQLAALRATCGITRDTVVRFRIGWTGERYAWPVYDEDGVIRNVRLYQYGATDDKKVISFTAQVSELDGTKRVVKYGAKNVRLFPLQAVLESSEDYVLLCEGEKDAVNAAQLGFPAVTATGGAGQWQPEFCNPHVRGKYVFICYDVDAKGKLGARKIQALLKNIARRAAILELPAAGLPHNGDLTDFLLMQANPAEALQRLIDDLRGRVCDEDGEVRNLPNLAATKQPQYHNQRVRVDAHIVGKETTPFTAERGYRLVCPQSRGKICDRCTLHDNNGDMQVTVPKDSKEVLYVIERNDSQIKSWLSERAGLEKCNLWTAEAVDEDKSSVEKVLLSTTVDQRTYDGGPSEYVQQLAYVVDQNLAPNTVVTVTGRMTSHPKDQSNILIVTASESSSLSIDTFDPSPETHEMLQFFQPEEYSVEGINKRLEDRWADLSANVTRIHRRPYIHLITDLVAHSLLRFECFGRLPDRCWLEGYIGGDTRQGKSEVAKRLHTHYRAGELVVTENASLSGILGGAQKIGNDAWMVSWGKVPLNDRGWVTFDECQNLSLQTMGALSGMRSSGVAEIDKIRVEKVSARTRILWLSNPRSDDVNVDQLAQGVLLVPDVFGRPEDVARLDMASVVRARDVDVSVLSERHQVPHTHTTDLCHLLVMFAWSRTPSQIEFTEGAAQQALHSSEVLARKYTSDIKLVEGMEQRIKLARIAGAVAALTYSSPDGKRLVVDRVHVSMAEQVLDRLYCDPAFGYDEYAEAHRHGQTVKDRDSLIGWCKSQPEELLRSILRATEIRLFDIQNYGDFSREAAQTQVSYLLQQRALIISKGMYIKNAEFVTILRTALDQKWYVPYKSPFDKQPVQKGNGNGPGTAPPPASVGY